MNSDTNETIAGIVREMRDLGKLDEICRDMIPRTGECKPGGMPLAEQRRDVLYVAWLLGTEGGAE